MKHLRPVLKILKFKSFKLFSNRSTSWSSQLHRSKWGFHPKIRFSHHLYIINPLHHNQSLKSLETSHVYHSNSNHAHYFFNPFFEFLSYYHRVNIKTPALEITHLPNIWEILANNITPGKKQPAAGGFFLVFYKGKTLKSGLKKYTNYNPQPPKISKFWQILNPSEPIAEKLADFNLKGIYSIQFLYFFIYVKKKTSPNLCFFFELFRLKIFVRKDWC